MTDLHKLVCSVGEAEPIAEAVCQGAESGEQRVTAMFAAAAIKKAVKDGADVNGVSNDELRVTPTFAAACAGRFDSIAALAALGADVTRPSAQGVTPLFAAIRFDRPLAIAALIRAGASPDALNRGGETPLTFAAHLAHDKCVLALLEAGAQINAVNAHGETLLSIVQRRGDLPELAATITAKGAALPAARVPLQVGAPTGDEPLSVVLRTHFLSDWLLERLALPDLHALSLVSRAGFGAVARHFAVESRVRCLKSEAAMRIMCRWSLEEQALLSRLMRASNGRWIVLQRDLAGNSQLHSCVLKVMSEVHDAPGVHRLSAGNLCVLDDADVDWLEDEFGSGDDSTPRFLRVASLRADEPVHASLPLHAPLFADGVRNAPFQLAPNDQCALAVCSKCGALRPEVRAPGVIMCLACVAHRPLVWLTWRSLMDDRTDEHDDHLFEKYGFHAPYDDRRVLNDAPWAKPWVNLKSRKAGIARLRAALEAHRAADPVVVQLLAAPDHAWGVVTLPKGRTWARSGFSAGGFQRSELVDFYFLTIATSDELEEQTAASREWQATIDERKRERKEREERHNARVAERQRLHAERRAVRRAEREEWLKDRPKRRAERKENREWLHKWMQKRRIRRQLRAEKRRRQGEEGEEADQAKGDQVVEKQKENEKEEKEKEEEEEEDDDEFFFDDDDDDDEDDEDGDDGLSPLESSLGEYASYSSEEWDCDRGDMDSFEHEMMWENHTEDWFSTRVRGYVEGDEEEDEEEEEEEE